MIFSAQDSLRKHDSPSLLLTLPSVSVSEIIILISLHTSYQMIIPHVPQAIWRTADANTTILDFHFLEVMHTLLHTQTSIDVNLQETTQEELSSA